MADMEMLERVARAIYACRCRTNNTPANWDAAPIEERVCLKVEARAAIEAMREPTEEMLEAVIDGTSPYVAGPLYTAMIDALLKEEGNG